jgi:hypothetical protein
VENISCFKKEIDYALQINLFLKEKKAMRLCLIAI